MNKWAFIIASLLLSFFYFDSSAQTSRPNIILILGDDVGYEIPACNGGKSYQTPNIDMMAQQGMRFTQCHASPLCSPSRFMLLTGKYNFRNYTEWGKMDRGQKTIGNMFRDAGYATACFGKWQLNGGGESIHTFGFDNYCVWEPLGGGTENRYKNPKIYSNGIFVPDSLTLNKYGEDIFTDSVLNFIDSNKVNPFFIYYPMVLCHTPQSPTPDDPQFAAWDPKNPTDSNFFPSMVKYMDKKIGQVIDKVKSLGIENNTVIIYVGDNGTTGKISSDIDENEVTGGKSHTTEAGTHVPLLIYWKGKITEGAVNDDLVDFSDFLPTLAAIANIPLPVNNGTIDGVNFAPRLIEEPGTPRDWIFYHYNPKLANKSSLKRWAQTKNYKLYDTSASGSFYNIANDLSENYPVPDSLLTYPEDSIKQQLQIVLDGYAELALKTPVLSNPVVSDITDSSAILGAAVTLNNNYSLILRGTVYDIAKNVLASDNGLAEGDTSVSAYNMLRTGLSPQKQYFYKGYALNDNGFGLSDESSFYTLSKPVIQQPSAFTASPFFGSVTLQWGNAVFPANGAKNAGYLLVYSTGIPQIVTYPNGKAPGDAISNGTLISTISSSLPALPSTTTSQNGLTSNTLYHFLLVPYTWDGKNVSTYNYFTSGAVSAIATTLTPPDPVINSISPATADFANGKFTLTVRGINFYKGLSTINWNGTALATVYVSPGKLTASVGASCLIVPGICNITVLTKGAVNISNSKTVTVSGSASPLFISDTSALPSFGNICLNTTTGPNSFNLAGSGLDGTTIIIGPLPGYTFSTTPGGTFSSSLSVIGYGSSFSQMVYVNFMPLSPQSYNGNISVSGAGAAPINIAVSGSGINTPTEVATTSITSITQTGATLQGALTEGCSHTMEYGIEYSTLTGFSSGARLASTNLSGGNFSAIADGLSPNTNYYYKAYAIINSSTIYGAELSFTTSRLLKPVANTATGIFQTNFTANWNPVPNASVYRLDVNTDSTFGTSTVVHWTFPNSPDNAVVDSANGINTNRQITATSAGIVNFTSGGASTNCASATGWANGANKKWWQINFDATGSSGLIVSSKQKSSSNGPAYFKLQYKIDSGGIWADVPGGAITVANNFTTGVLNNILLPDACNNQSSVFLRWIVTSTTSAGNTFVQPSGTSRIDDILVASNTNLPGYDNKSVNYTAEIVTGLLANSNYYYRVRAASSNDISVNSNTISVKTLKPLTGSIISQADVKCNGASNGIVTIKGNGGAGTYTYSMDNGATYFTKGTFTNLESGGYSIKIKDATNSKTDVPVIINEPQAITITETLTDIKCNGITDGSIVLTGSGGAGPLSYTMGSVTNNTGNFIGLAAGIYSYSVTDSNSCGPITGNITITEPTAIVVQESHSAISCNGGTTTITITAEGGAGDYTGTGEFTQSAGMYTYTVTDATGCSATIDVTLEEPALLLVHESHSAISCNGGTTTITITAEGGAGDYTGTGEFTQIAGMYTYTVTDANGCSATIDVTLEEPALLIVHESHSAINCNGGTTTVTITAEGGTGDYTGTGEFNQSAGIYTYTVTDANGCSKSITVTINQPAALVLTSTGAPIKCFGGSTVVTISAGGGTAPYTGTGSYAQFAGTTTYIVTDANGCSKSKTITKTQPPALSGSIVSQSNVTCIGGTNGSVTAAGNGGTPGYSYKINITGIMYQVSGTFNGLKARNYIITIKDKNGCIVNVPVTITQSGDSCTELITKVPDKNPEETKNAKGLLNVKVLPAPDKREFTLLTCVKSNTLVEIKGTDMFGKQFMKQRAGRRDLPFWSKICIRRLYVTGDAG